MTEKPALQNRVASNGRIKQLYWSLVRSWFITWNDETCNRVQDIATDRYMIYVLCVLVAVLDTCVVCSGGCT